MQTLELRSSGPFAEKVKSVHQGERLTRVFLLIAFLSAKATAQCSKLHGSCFVLRILAPDTRRFASSMLEVVRSSGRNLLALLNDLLDFSKIDTGHLKLEHIAVDLPHLIKDCAQLMLSKAEAKGIPLQIQLPEEPVWVLADEVRLRQVILNLLSNAIKFTEKGYVQLKLRTWESKRPHAVDVELSVKDSGVGIPQDRIEKIFDAFEQAEMGTTRKFGGTGLGLAISREIVQAFGGELTVDSRYGQGSEFTVRLELEVSATRAKTIKPVIEPQPIHLESVLLVDDDRVNRMVTRKFLERAGVLEIEEAVDGYGAIEAVRRTEWDMVLMDVQMPEMDGLEATRRIRALEQSDGRARTTIVAITAHAMAEDEERCLDAGMDAYVSKPVSMQMILTVLHPFASKKDEAKPLSSTHPSISTN